LAFSLSNHFVPTESLNQHLAILVKFGHRHGLGLADSQSPHSPKRGHRGVFTGGQGPEVAKPSLQDEISFDKRDCVFRWKLNCCPGTLALVSPQLATPREAGVAGAEPRQARLGYGRGGVILHCGCPVPPLPSLPQVIRQGTRGA
jgi:hypothetical protein